MASTVLPNGIIIPEKFSRDWYADLYHNWEELDNLLGGGTPKDGTLTIQKNGSTVGTFSANQATDETVNITVPTATSELTNDSGYITGVAWNDVSNKPTFATVATSGSYNDLSNKPTIPTKTSDLTNDSCIPLSGTSDITGTEFFKSTSDSQLQIGSGTSTTTGGCFVAYGSEYSNANLAGSFRLRAITTTNYDLQGLANGTLKWSGNVLLIGAGYSRIAYSGQKCIEIGAGWHQSAQLYLFDKTAQTSANNGIFILRAYDDTNGEKDLIGYPDGTLTWNGQSIQTTSDQRLKQQIAEIDDKLLDAWEDVDLVQFKYNDAVDQKGDNARLHTGYVVQQIDNACKSHNVDISQYGLYCHEEYPQETEEVEVEQADGTKTKERKIIREASEHYSLRYTEALIVECKYLRRCIARLTARIEELEKGNNTK